MDKEKKVAIGDIVNNIIALIGSRLVFGGLLAFLGLRVALDPNSAPKKIAWGLGLAILIAMVGLLIGYIKSKSFNRTNLIPLIETIAFTILGLCMILFDNAFGSVIEELFFILIIITCTINILCLKNYRDIKTKLDRRAAAQEAKKDEDSVIHDVNKAIKDDFIKYNGEFISAADFIKRKMDATSWGQMALNIALIIVSVIMLITRFAGMRPVYYISGIIMALSGLNEIVLSIRSYRAKKRFDTIIMIEDKPTNYITKQ